MKKLFTTLAAGLAALSLTGCFPAQQASDTTQQGGMNGTMILIIYIVAIVAFVYFLMIRPQKKQRQKQNELFNSMSIGDSVLTTSGFYGVIIDITDDTVIVEFGSNKNCRIPMQKAAIVQIEKPNQG
jgi:preprotein translocase, YajC subunit